MSELHGCITTKKFKDMRKNTQETNLKSGKVEIKPKENGLGKLWKVHTQIHKEV